MIVLVKRLGFVCSITLSGNMTKLKGNFSEEEKAEMGERL